MCECERLCHKLHLDCQMIFFVFVFLAVILTVQLPRVKEAANTFLYCAITWKVSTFSDEI